MESDISEALSQLNIYGKLRYNNNLGFPRVDYRGKFENLTYTVMKLYGMNIFELISKSRSILTKKTVC